jgi:hypothetical protein
MKRYLALLALPLAALGCQESEADRAVARAASPKKGAQVRFVNFGSAPVSVEINAQSAGAPVAPGSATAFRLVPPSRPSEWVLTVAGKTIQESVPVESAGVYSVCLQGDKLLVVEGEPVKASPNAARIYFAVAGEAPAGIQLRAKSPTAAGATLTPAEGGDVAPGDYVFEVILNGSPVARFQRKLEDGDAVSAIYAPGARKLAVVLNNEKMKVSGFGGASPTG